jgi:molecular chaperone GrpE
MEKLGVSEIDCLNEPFDPNLHEAVMHVEDDSVGPSTVVEVLQKGYQRGDLVIRHSIVKVAN